MIQSLLRSGKKYTAGPLTVHYESAEISRAGDYMAAYLIPKLAGGAVERNRLKRWLREDLRNMAPELNLGGTLVIRFKGTAREADHQSLTRELEKILEKIKVDG